MGNQHCCEDGTRAGDFNKNKSPQRSPAIRVDNLDYSRKCYQNNSPYDYSRPTKADLGILKNNLIRRESDLNKLQDSGSISAINRNPPQYKVEPVNNSFVKETELLNRSGSRKQAESPKRGSPKKEYSFQENNKSREENSKVSPEIADKLQKQSSQSSINLPKLTPAVEKTVTTQNFFSQIKPRYTQRKTYGDQVYHGQIERNYPNGFGRFYKKDGSLYIGHFAAGKAQGKGVYVFPTGAYYEGMFDNNKANDKNGKYISDELQYRGGFKNNLFHGDGEEEGEAHKFAGVYTNGFKSLGKFQWYQDKDLYTYEGGFNEVGQFHGRGRLTQPNGQYQGQFQNGYKHGQGVFKYNNGIKYQGEYLYNKREGKGRLINPNNKIAYEGNFSDGLPHGEGIILDKDGLRHSSRWIMGIDSDII